MKTGDTIQISEKEIEVLDTHLEGRKDASFLIEKAANHARLLEDRFWNTVYDLYPELKGFDIHISWKTKILTVRGRKERE